jgi:branched-chain amino acid transport system ATP-binding protein
VTPRTTGIAHGVAGDAGAATAVDEPRNRCLDITGLRAGYGRVTVLHDMSFSVPAGSVLGISGPNGAGKTTLLNAISGINRECTGEVRLGEQALSRKPAHKRVACGLALVPEGRQIIGSLDVGANLDVTVMSRGRFRKDAEHRRRMAEVLELFPRLTERLSVPGLALSGGEQQMLAIARALMTGPAVLLLDEPSQGLAPAVVDDVAAALAKLKGRITMVVVEHNHHVLDAVADRVVTMRWGRLSES